MSSPVDHVLDELKMQNRVWVKEVLSKDPTFFKRTAESQQPKASASYAEPYDLELTSSCF